MPTQLQSHDALPWQPRGAVRRRSSKRESGTSAVEFAILMPVLFMVIAGIVDFGRAFFLEIQLANAAREGARAAVVLAGDSTYTAKVTARATAGAPAVQSLTISTTSPDRLCPTPADPNASAQVTASAPFSWIIMRPAIALVGGTWGLNGTLSSTAVMQCGG
ncbi:TadE/TadG family type IV pilus assembly protein [Monashia sp. NPDC004114]